MECMGRTVVDFYVCLVVSVEAGEWHLEKKAGVRSWCLNFRRWAIRNLRETCGFHVSLWALKGLKLRVTFLLALLFVCLFVLTRYTLYTEHVLLTCSSALGSLLAITKTPSLGTPASLVPSLHRCFHLSSYFLGFLPLHPFHFHSVPSTAVPRARVQCFMCILWRDTSSTHMKKFILGISGVLFSWTIFCLQGPYNLIMDTKISLSNKNRCHEIFLLICFLMQR